MKNIFIVIVIVAILAVALVALMWKAKSPMSDGGPTPSSSVDPNNNSGGGMPNFPELTAEENKLLQVPGASATDAERAKHMELVAKYAVSTNSLGLDSCVAKPLVVKIKDGEQLSISNTGKTDVTLSIDAKDYAVKAGASTSIKAGFGRGPGLFGYGCIGDGKMSGAGLIWVTE